MKVLFVLLLAALCSACESTRLLENRIVVAVSAVNPDGDCTVEALSRWGVVSIGTRVSKADAEVLCALMRQRKESKQ